MKISIITAAYKSHDTISAAIASVAAQTYRDVEHIIVTANSDRELLNVIENSQSDRKRLVIRPNKGVYDALNHGIQEARGDIIGFTHSDDFLANNEVLSKIAKAFEDPDIEAVFGDLDYVSKADTSQVTRHWSTGPFRPERLKYGWMPAHPTLYLRRDVYNRLGTYDESFRISADYDFILRYFSQDDVKSVYIPQVLYKMRSGGISNRSLSNILHKMREDIIALRRNRIGGVLTLTMKNLSKVSQFGAYKNTG